MSQKSALSKESLWTWEEVLSKYPSKCAAPVSAFQFQKAPLAPYWDRITDGEIIGEVDLNAGLDSSNSYKERLSTGRSNKSNKRYVKKEIKYYFVKMVQLEGYNLKVRFLGFPSNLQDKVTEHERWICYNQLKSFGYHLKNGGTFTVPRLDNDLVPESKERVKKRLLEVVGECTVNPLMMGWIEKQEKEIRWTKQFTRVEVRNKDCFTEMLPGYISKTIGRRVEVMCWGTPAFKRQGIWVHEDSDLIQLEGWTKTAGGKMNASVTGYDPAPLEPTKLADHIRQGVSNNIEVGMMFEFINPLRLDDIAVGQVTEVLSHGYFICNIVSEFYEDDLQSYMNGINELHFHVTSDQLFPLGSFAGETPSPRPSEAANDKLFTWASYLEENGCEELPLPRKNTNGHGFKENTLIEAVDTHNSELVCPAMIIKIVHPHAMKVRFLGWDPKYDQWKPISSLEIFPVGWCQFRDYPLEPPPLPAAPVVTETEVPDAPASVKRGRGRPRKMQPTTGTGAVLADQIVVGSLTEANLKKLSKAHVPKKKRTRRRRSSGTRTVTVCATATSSYDLRPRVSQAHSSKSQVLSLTKENLEKLKKQSQSQSTSRSSSDKNKASRPHKSRSLLTSFSRL